MQAKTLMITFIVSFLSIIFNLYNHQDIIVSLLNSLILGLSVYWFQKKLNISRSAFNIFLIISLSLIPLFYYFPTKIYFFFLPLFSLGFFYFYRLLPKKYVILIYGLFLLLGNLYFSEIIKYPFRIQTEQLIFNSPEVNYNIHRHQQDALFIPYKARLIIYSKLIYVYAFLTNLFSFLNLKNLSDVLLIANLYPLFVGIYNIFKQKNEFTNICITTFAVTALTLGIDRSTDKFQIFLSGPAIIFLILSGTRMINKKLYFALWILSIFIYISPKI